MTLKVAEGHGMAKFIGYHFLLAICSNRVSILYPEILTFV